MNERVLATAMCEAYARNCGNDFKDHFDTRAAIIWMQQALEEVGVAELIEATKSYTDSFGIKPVHVMEAKRLRLRAALARVGGKP